MTSREDIDNSNNEDHRSQPDIFAIVNCALNVPLMLISIMGNILVLAAILRTPSLRSPSTILMCSLAVSDIFVGLVAQPIAVAFQLTEKDFLHQAVRTVSFLAIGGSFFTITAVSVDRFAALHYHLRYPSLMTTQRALYILSALWLVIFLSSWLHFWNTSAYYSVAAAGIAICLLLSSSSYIGIYKIARHHQLQIQNQQQAMEIDANDNRNLLRTTKTAKSTFIYYVAMLLCYTPMFIAVSISASVNHFSKPLIFVETIAFMNSSINPFLYCWRLRQLRTAVIKIARQMLCKQMQES